MSEKRSGEGALGLASGEQDYSKLQGAPSNSVTRPFENAYFDYMKTLQALFDEFQKRSNELYLDFVQSLQDAWTHSDAQERSAQAYQNYWHAVNQSWESSTFPGAPRSGLPRLCGSSTSRMGGNRSSNNRCPLTGNDRPFHRFRMLVCRTDCPEAD